VSLEAVDGGPDGRLGEHGCLLADRGEVDGGQLGDRRVVVAGDRAVAGHPDSRLTQRVDDAQGAVVVVRAHRGGEPLAPEQIGGGAVTVALGVAAGDYAHVIAEAVPPHRGPVALPSLGGDGLAAAVHVDDVLVAETGQVVDDERLAAVVGGPHHIDVAEVHPASHQDQRQLAGQVGQPRRGQLRAEQDHGLAAEAQQRLDGAVLVVRGGDQGRHDLVAGLGRGSLDVLGQLGLERVADVDGDAQVLGTAELHQARGAVGTVADLLGRRQHTGPGRLARARRAAQHDGDQRR
jgi:hypothetical protein